MPMIKILICIFAGLILPFAFAPHDLWPIALISPALFLYGLTDSVSPIRLTTPKRGAWRGFLFGFSFFGVGASWVYVSIHTYGNTNVFFAGLITVLFLLILASFFALLGGLQCRFFSVPHLLCLTFPSLGVLIEAFLGKFFTGFPWLFLGYSQAVSPLKGYAPLLGVYGVSFLVYLMGALLFSVVFLKSYYRWMSAGLIGILLGLGAFFSTIQWTHPERSAIHVALVQGNIPQEIKWDDHYAQRIVDTYVKLSANHWDHSLVVWPEAAIPIPLPMSQPLTSILSTMANRNQATLMTGIPIQDPLKHAYYNSLIVLGANTGTYHKRLLVPFGEYVPMGEWLRGLVGFFNLPMSDMIPGALQQSPLILGQNKIGTFICYEICYPDRVLESLDQKDAFLTVISNDAWFGHSWAAAQHAEIAQFAAIATQRYLALDSNNGITAIIDPHGKFLKTLPPYTTGVLTGTIIPYTGVTPWGNLGNFPLLALFLLFLLLARTYHSTP